MAKVSDYKIIAFQRHPGRWRANVTPVSVAPAATQPGMSTLGFVTTQDSSSEAAAVMAANQLIKELES